MSTSLGHVKELRDAGKYEQSIELAKDLISGTSENRASLYAIIAHCYILIDDLVKAESCLEKSNQLEPRNPLWGWNKSRLLIKLKKPSEALSLAKGTLKNFPDDFEGLTQVGACLRITNEHISSLKYLDRAIQFKPNYAEALFNRGLVNLYLENKTEALEDLETAFKEKPHIQPIWQTLLGIKINLELYQSALETLIIVISEQNSEPKLFDNFIACAGKLNAKSVIDTIEYYNSKISLQPAILFYLYETYQKAGDLILAQTGYKELLKKFPTNSEIYYKLGFISQTSMEIDAAINYYNQAIEYQPDYAMAYNNLGVCLQDRDNKKAIENFKTAIKIDHNYADPYYNLGNSLMETNVEEAIENYKFSLSLKPNYASAHHNLGNALKKINDKIGAIECYTRVLSIEPNNQSAQHMIASLTGDNTEKAPSEYIEALFDHYAKNFDNSLVCNLDYRTPELLVEMLNENFPEKSYNRVLDIGCGTGLMGEKLDFTCNEIYGIDLSQKMLDEAERKKVYTNLFKVEIIDFLKNQDLNFQLFVSADVFVYLGDLSELFRLIKNRNGTNGILAFSTENKEGSGFRLEESGRYSHSTKYIQELANQFQYKIIDYSLEKIRKNKNGFILGGLYIMRF